MSDIMTHVWRHPTTWAVIAIFIPVFFTVFQWAFSEVLMMARRATGRVAEPARGRRQIHPRRD
jgi:hypothetical protein